MSPLYSLLSGRVSSSLALEEGLGGRTGALAVKLFLLTLSVTPEVSSSAFLLLALGLVRKSST